MLRRAFLVSTFVAALTVGRVIAAAPELFFGEMPVQYATPDQALTLDLHRFLHPPSAMVTASAAEFDSSKFALNVKVPQRGLVDVTLRAEADGANATRVLTVAAAGKTTTTITFKPAKPAKKVIIAGAFNGWNQNANTMGGPDADGIFSIELSLAPGRHPYKFIVDGEWTLDPANHETEDNGQGGKNSVLVVSGSNAPPPTIFAERATKNSLQLRGIIDDAITQVSAIAQGRVNDTILDPKITGDTITVTVPPEAEAIRVVAATKSGRVSNTVLYTVRTDSDWRDALLYYALTDRFVDGDKKNDHPVADDHVKPQANYHGGDLRGIRRKIEDGYFESLGVNAIWIAPLNKNPDHAYQESPEPHRWYTGYHGYWPISPTEIDPHIGSDDELRALIDSAHAHKIKVIADLVLHHVHEEHPWWKQHRDWFGKLELPDGRKNLRLWDEQQFTTWFEPYLPSFDFSKDEPVRALIDNTVWWATRYQLDGFRLDAVKHILPSFWWKFRAGLRERVEQKRGRPLYLVGETFKDRAGIDSFVGPNMLDGQFDFPLYDAIKDSLGTGTASLRSLDDALTASERAYGKGTLMSPLIGNHDKGRFMAYADGDLPDPKIEKEEEVGWQKPPSVDDPQNYRKIEMAQALLLSDDGVPMIYYGDEFGMTGAGDPDNRRDMRFDDQLSAPEKSVLADFRKLTALRRAHAALRYGSRRALLREDDALAFVRAYLDDRVVVVLNRATSPKTFSLKVAPEIASANVRDLLSGEKIAVNDGAISVSVPARGFRFLAPASK